MTRASALRWQIARARTARLEIAWAAYFGSVRDYGGVRVCGQRACDLLIESVTVAVGGNGERRADAT